jgi:RNA polymerase sigma-70 factor (ECF subfamily)
VTPRPRLDEESRDWIERLRTPGRERDVALERLHALLLKAARYETNRRGAAFPHLRGNDLDDLAQQSANDALVAILAKLDEFRGDSRFTTWAYKFALFEAAVKVRRRAWQGREVPIEPESWSLLGGGSAPDRDVESTELYAALEAAIRTELSAQQRQVLVAVVVNGVPIDVLAERRNASRGALYKTIHDARRKLRAALTAGGFDLRDEGGTP